MLTAKPGDQLLHYRLIRKIGEGGMGVVYEAEDTRLGRTVAIKLLQPSFSSNDEVRQRFLREARAASAIDHPNLCTIYTVEELPDGALLLVMARYLGQTVAELMQKTGRLDADMIREIGSQTAAGLHAAHMAGIVHRDIKPGNIFLLQSGTVKILDFGLSRIQDQNQLTKPHQVMGTLAYMPPEQIAGNDIDHRADIWALGAVLYELAVGHPPFRQSTTAATIAAITEGRYVPLSFIRPDLPKHLLLAVEGSLRSSPTERHASALDLRTLLEGESKSTLAKTFDFAATAPTEISVPVDAGMQVAPTMLDLPNAAHSSVSASPSQAFNDSRFGPVTSLAVLPFRNTSPDPENEYFSDGLTDELISSMGRIAGLRVVSRTSAFSFKGSTQNIREIGEALNVDVILEGSVRRSGQRVRVHTQLVQVRDGFPIWSERFDREMADVFELQDELAYAVVSAVSQNRALDLHVSHLQLKRPMLPEAYEAYLKGRYHWNQRNAKDFQIAGKYFERALQLDPQSAAAHAGIADFYCLQGTFGGGGMTSHEAWTLARSSALQAIQLDPSLPEGHLALASVYNFYDWDWEKARQHMERAIELQPQRGESYYMYGAHLITQGLLEQALIQVRIGLKYDPVSAPLLAAEALIHAYLGDYDNCILLSRSALKTFPHYAELYYALGMGLTFAGRAPEGIEVLEQGLASTQVPFLHGWLAEAHKYSGNHDEARASLQMLLDMAEQGSPMAIPIALAATALGENDLALDWLEKAVETRDILAAYLTVIPGFQPLHDEPRYKQLVEKMNLKHPSKQRRRNAAR
ncbi:MAG: protein kinase domain-containing protein [Acidobacteriaceae bacterium]